MENIRPLFVSYFYPPAGGSGLPGSQRTVKFLRYLQHTEDPQVLTLEPECYPQGLLLNFTTPLPVRNEHITRVPSRDRFLQAMQLRMYWGDRGISKGEQNTSLATVESSEIAAGDEATNRPFIQQIKDFVFHYYYFPDQIAGPWLQPAVKAGVQLVRKNKVNIIFATGMPWTALVVGRLIAKKTGVPFIADFRDPWLGNPFLESKGWLLDWRDRMCEQKIIEQAALVTANTVPLREEFVQRYPQVGADKIISLPNGYDSTDFKHLAGRKDGGQKGRKLILMHAGFLYGKRDPAPLLDALTMLCQKNPALSHQVEFHQLGGITVDYDIQRRYRELFEQGIVQLLGQVPFSGCLEKLFQADILVIIQPGTKTQVPSKLYDYLCMNRPVLTITPPDGALGVMIREEGFGDLFSPQETGPLMEKLKELCLLKQENRLSLTPDYPNRDKFDVRHIAHLLEEHMLRILQPSD